MSDVVTVRRDGVVLDMLVHERFGRTAGLVEATLALNPGLADLGPVLPLLTAVRLPADAPAPPTIPVVRLWD